VGAVCLGLQGTHSMPLALCGSVVNSSSDMICPQCQAEYRQGFTVCADCAVSLVDALPSKSFPAESESGTTDDPFCSFWQGDDPRIHAELCALLDDESIPHKTVRQEDHVFHLKAKSAFQIGVPFSQFERAEAAVSEAYGTENERQDAVRLLPDRRDQ
jgi:hypothetical protein